MLKEVPALIKTYPLPYPSKIFDSEFKVLDSGRKIGNLMIPKLNSFKIAVKEIARLLN